MANVIKKTTNRFIRGLIMDFSPENTKNEVLSNALNATLLTFNGNELSLQNDMGNARVETAYLPEGYMPVGTCEYGGIIYIVSYNPLEDKSLIGCFPSPERNISSDELGHLTNPISHELFLDIITGEIKQASYSVLLKLDNLNPGDKFIITSNNTIYLEKIKDLYKKNAEDNFILQENPIIALNIVSIEDNGKIVYLNSDVRQYEVIREITEGDSKENKTFRYSILGSEKEGTSITKLDIDSYRNAVSSGYSVFRSKVSGKLAILAELIMIDSYSVTHSIKAKPESDTEFDIIIHTDVSPKLNSKNYLYEPKLKYYYLSNSQGYMQTVDDNGEGIKFPLFGNDNSISSFYKINLKNIYSSNNSQLFDVTLKDVSEFKFPVSNTYHGRLTSFNGNNYSGNDIYTKFFKNNYHKINVNQIKNNSGYFYNTLQAIVYEYESGGNSKEIPYTNPVLNELYTYYVKTSNSEYVDVERNTDYKTEILYEIATTPAIATENIIKDKSIEKFLYQQILYYKRATLKDLASGKILYYRENGENGEILYKQLIGELDENALYYVYETESTLVSIGYEVTVVNSLNIYYYTGIKTYYTVSDDKKNIYYDFDRYPKDENSPSLGAPFNLYRIVENESFREATEEELLLYNNDSTSIALYYIENYKKVLQSDIDNSISEDSILFIVFPQDEIITKNYFIPSQEFNYIKGTTSVDTYPKNDPIEVLTIADFMPELDSENNDKYNYNDVKLASIKIPDVVINNGLDLPFKYDYTIIPCMNYGRLDHLAVSNTIDFGKLHAFNQSEFHTWKYYIENGLLRLTFGADVYDTYEKSKVDGIILEFYDLWGYAGTLEITDKKSYSGVFTKIIPLNTINALSNKKIIKDQDNNLKYSNEEYVRNIEIINNDSIFKYKDFIINHNDITGWKSSDTSKIIDNDCGTLYPNLIYGVKAYFRRKTTGDNYEFIPKKDFFLYTLPIFNEYYSSLQNFDTIENPELLFTLTYKLLDNSTKTPLNSEEFINGYNSNDYEKINTYLNGNYSNNTLEIIKYYKYTGVSKLYLEVGLNESYKNLNLFNNKDINNHYKCNLLLVSNNNESFDIKLENSEITDGNSILNYTENFKNNNYLKFVTDEGLSNSIELSNISEYNFISNTDPVALNIEYSFDVGYKATISNITTIQIPATTVCALFHRKLDGEYNYGDFGIYPRIINGITKLYSETMIYTAGDITTSILGICKLISTEGNLYEQCSSLDDWYESPTKEIKKLFLLHTGNNLKNINKHLKKLAFYLPHVHGFIINNKEYYPNLSYGKNEFDINTDVLLIPIGKDLTVGGHGDDAYGNYPMNHYKQAPKFNFIANTLDSLEQYSEFISVIDYVGDSEGAIWKVDYDDGKNGATGWSEPITLRIFEGFTGTLLLSFNQKLLKTMSSIYAYNPDYNLLDINTGNINLLDYSPIFNSNLVNTHSEFKDDIVLNDYILLGGVKISDYLSYLTLYSEIATKTKNTKLKNTETEDTEIFLNLVNFTANFENCGTNTNPVLLSSLTYKAPMPEEMMNDLVFDNSQRTILKHSNGSVLLLNGIPNKKTLYGYDSIYNKLVTLDVSNYIILEDGTLELNYLKTENKNNKYYTNEDVQINESWLNGYQFMNTEMSGTIILNKVNSPSYLKCFEDKVYLILMFNPRDNYKYFDISFTLKSNTHKLTLSNIEFKNKYAIIPASYNNLTISTLDLYNLEDKLILSSLINKEQVTINNNFVVNSYINKLIAIERVNNTNFYRINKPDLWDLGNDLAICLIELNINRLSIMYDKYIIPDNIFIDTIKTIEYSTIKNHKYIINEKYNDARFRGTSVTINDLVYKPNINEHRLYMKNGLYQYDNYLENKIAYRDAGWGVADGYKGHQNYNDLFMATGPCFTLDNL